MPIFDDPRKELNRLQRQLLEEDETYQEDYLSDEEWLDDEIAEAKAMLGMKDEEEDEPEIYRNYANGYGRIQTKPVQMVDLDDYSDEEVYEVEAEPVKGAGGQLFLTILLTLGIVAVAAYWVAVLL